MNSDADFMSVEVAGFQEAHIVGRHYRQTMLFCQLNRGMKIAFFVLTTGTDQLQIVAIRKMLLIEGETLLYQRHVSADQADANVAFTPAGQQNQPFLMFNQPVAIDPWPQSAIAALIGTRNEQSQVLIAGIVGR